MSNRNNIQQLIDTKIPDNNNNEITASMVRSVFEELMNSYFNKDEDQLQSLKYDNQKNLAQQFASVPIIKSAIVGPFDIGGSGSTNVNVQGEAVSCVMIRSQNMSFLTIDFNPSFSLIGKQILFNISINSPTDNNLIINQVTCVNYGLSTPNQIKVGLREVYVGTQAIFLNITII